MTDEVRTTPLLRDSTGHARQSCFCTTTFSIAFFVRINTIIQSKGGYFGHGGWHPQCEVPIRRWVQETARQAPFPSYPEPQLRYTCSDTTSVSSPHGSDRSHPSQRIIPLSGSSPQTFCSPEAFSASVKKRTIDAQKRMYTRYHPYTPRTSATPLELRFAARTLASSSHTGMTMEDVIRVCHTSIGLAIY